MPGRCELSIPGFEWSTPGQSSGRAVASRACHRMSRLAFRCARGALASQSCPPCRTSRLQPRAKA
eukprot:7724444-Alexandrium_andersonii.AAC.1